MISQLAKEANWRLEYGCKKALPERRHLLIEMTQNRKHAGQRPETQLIRFIVVVFVRWNGDTQAREHAINLLRHVLRVGSDAAATND